MGMIVFEYPNWFVEAEYNFKTYLEHFKGKPNLKFIQAGVFTGDATVWLLDNILTNESSLLVDVDTWKGSDEEEHKNMDFEDVFLYYKERIPAVENTLIIWPAGFTHAHRGNMVLGEKSKYIITGWFNYDV